MGDDATGAGERVLAAVEEGRAAFSEGRFADAVAAWERALAAAEAAGLALHPVIRADLASAWLWQGELARARAAYEAARQEGRELGLPDAEGAAESGLGHLAMAEGRAGDAAGHFEAAAALLEAHGAPDVAARALADAAFARQEAGDWRGAAAPLTRALALAPEQPGLWSWRGQLHLAARRLEEAAGDLERARSLHGARGEAPAVATAAAMLAAVYRAAGEPGRAVACQEEVLALEREHGFSVDEAVRLLEVPAPPEAPGPAPGGEPAPPRRPAASASARPFLLFAPPCRGTWGPVFPRGATALASFLEHHGVPCAVVPLSEHVRGVTDAATYEARVAAAVRDAVEALRPRAVGISVTFSYLYPEGRRVARLVREAAPDVPVVMGGPHVTYYDRECLAEAPEIDLVVRGEGEWTALELLRALDAGADLAAVDGLTWRDAGGRVHRNRGRALGDVRELPEVDFGLLPAGFASRMEVTGVTSRGCEHRCRFCHEFRFWGGVVRQYPPGRIVGELARLAEGYGNPLRAIDDSMLDMRSAYFRELMAALGRSPHVPEGFALLTRIDTVDPAGLAAMREAGITRLCVGLESGSPAVLRAMNKAITVEQSRAGLETVAEAGIDLCGFFIVGHPGDDPGESELTLAFAREALARRQLVGLDVAMFVPYPGTPFYAHPARHGVRILTRDWARWRRTARPIAELETYPASAIYLAYLRMLEADVAARGGRDRAFTRPGQEVAGPAR